MLRNELMPKDVFVSHSDADAAVATALTDCIIAGTGLHHRDVLCTSHPNPDAQLKPGEDINRTLRKHLDDCRILVPIVSRESIKRNYVLFEIGGAWALEKRIMPVVVEKDLRAAMPEIIRGLIYTEFDSPARIHALILAISRECFVAADQPSSVTVDSAVQDYIAKIKNA